MFFPAPCVQVSGFPLLTFNIVQGKEAVWPDLFISQTVNTFVVLLNFVWLPEMKTRLNDNRPKYPETQEIKDCFNGDHEKSFERIQRAKYYRVTKKEKYYLERVSSSVSTKNISTKNAQTFWKKKKKKKKISDPQLNSPQSHQFLLNFSKSRQLLRDHVKELQWRFYKHCLHSIGSWMWLSTCELNGRTHPETKIPSWVMSSTWDSFCHWITYSLQEFSRDPIEKLGEYVYTLS